MINDIRRRTRTKYSSEEKIRIVLDGIRAEISPAELCQGGWLGLVLPVFILDDFSRLIIA